MNISIRTMCISTILFSSLSYAEVQPLIGEQPAVKRHLDQSMIETGHISLQELIDHGASVFSARFNILDGRGRPASTGTGAPRSIGQPDFIRTSGPDSSSCAGCHNQPFVGGAGDFVANVFVLSQAADPVSENISPTLSNERNTLGMFGAGPIEMLAREMTADLQNIKQNALNQASISGEPARHRLHTKGVDFGYVTAMPNGKIDPSEIEGIDWDLIVKPFHQIGAVVSIREFTNNAMNHHHGIQTTERFGIDTDADADGVYNELSVGDVTATTVFQATLPIPTQRITKDKYIRKAVTKGKKLFNQVGCNSCHKPKLRLASRFFSEPNPYNPAGNLSVADTNATLKWDMTKEGQSGKKLERKGKGAIIRAFTDLKRHNLCDDELRYYCNEQVPQGSLLGFAGASEFTVAPQPRSTEQFLTRKLWDVANSDPYGHRGDLSTMTEAILHHGGDARFSRDNFNELSTEKQANVIEFLKTLGVFEPRRPTKLNKFLGR